MLKLLAIVSTCISALLLGSFALHAQSGMTVAGGTGRIDECPVLLRKLSLPRYDTWQNRMRGWKCQDARVVRAEGKVAATRVQLPGMVLAATQISDIER